MPSRDLKDIHISSGVNHKLEPFCTVSINNGDLLGQLPPAEVRSLALQWLEAAEGAETDSIVWKLLAEMDLPAETIGQFIAAMRDKRAGSED